MAQNIVYYHANHLLYAARSVQDDNELKQSYSLYVPDIVVANDESVIEDAASIKPIRCGSINNLLTCLHMFLCL